MEGFKTIRKSATFVPSEREIPSFHARDLIPSADNLGGSSCIYFLSAAMEDLDAHIHWGEYRHDNLVEQGGYILGKVFRRPGGGYYAEAHRLVPVSGADGSPTYLDMGTDASYEAMIMEQDLIRDSDGELRRIGWYHTHPGGLPVFMSGTDRGTQSKSYSQDWQFAVVLNPQKKIWRAFHGGKVEDADCFFVCSTPGLFNKFDRTKQLRFTTQGQCTTGRHKIKVFPSSLLDKYDISRDDFAKMVQEYVMDQSIEENAAWTVYMSFDSGKESPKLRFLYKKRVSSENNTLNPEGEIAMRDNVIACRVIYIPDDVTDEDYQRMLSLFDFRDVKLHYVFSPKDRQGGFHAGNM